MCFTSDYLNVHDDPSLLIPLLSKVQQELNALESNEVRSLTSYLLADLDIKKEWDDQVITHVLLTLKHLGRRIEECDMLYKKQGFHILMKWTGLLETTKVVDTSVSQEALKCLSNCILLSGDTMKSWLIETKNALDTCARLLHSDTVSVDIQFLICRLLYLMTYDGPFIIDILMDLDLPHALYKILTRQVQGWLQDPETYNSTPPTSQPAILVCEAFKLQRNMMIALQDTSSTEETDSTFSIKEQVGERFIDILTPILDILYILPYPTPLPLIPNAPFTDALFVLNLYTYNLVRGGWYQSPRLAPYCEQREKALMFCLTSLIGVLDQTLTYLMPARPLSSSSTLAADHRPSSGLFNDGWKSLVDDRDLDRALALILTYLVTTMELAEPVIPRHSLISTPSLLFSRLVKLLSSTRFPQAREMAGELLYSHVGEDGNALIALVGYDKAKQTLTAKECTVDPPSMAPSTDTEDMISFDEMTDEEKEREAERLFVMFERVQLQD